MLSRSLLKNRLESIRAQLDQAIVAVINGSSSDALTGEILGEIDLALRSVRIDVFHLAELQRATLVKDGAALERALQDHDTPCHCCHCEDKRRRLQGELLRGAQMDAELQP